MFLNACEIGHIGRHGSTETAKALLRRGAKCVIAPFLSVRDIEATDYSHIYDGFHLVIPVALNFHRVRCSAFLGRGATSVGHMAYVVYGDPYSPEGGEIWELQEALIYETFRDLEWQKWSKEILNLCERLDRLWDVAISELSNCGPMLEKEIAQRLLRFCEIRQEANRGMYHRTVAETLATGERRLEYLLLAAEAYRVSVEKTEHGFNRVLYSGYACHLCGLHALEATTCRYLRREIEFTIVQLEFQQAIVLLEKATKEFEGIGATGDAKECLRLRDLAMNVISQGENADLLGKMRSLFHQPRPLM